MKPSQIKNSLKKGRKVANTLPKINPIKSHSKLFIKRV
jgi:hypothetical protein